MIIHLGFFSFHLVRVFVLKYFCKMVEPYSTILDRFVRPDVLTRPTLVPQAGGETVKDIASFQIAKGGERRHVMCVRERSGLNPGP